MKNILITIGVVIAFVYGIYYMVWVAEPNKMTRDCLSSHIESYDTTEYNVALKMYMPVTKTKTVCDLYSEFYPNPRWEAWNARQN